MNTSQTDPFETALVALLAPLARAFIARGMTLATVTENLKRAFVDAAIASEGQDVSDSRVSLITGLHRKDVKRLRDSSVRQNPPALNAAALTISKWAGTPEFLTADGHPRDLPRRADETGPGFDDLVRSTRADLAPGTVLAALISDGSVLDLENGRLRLMRRSYLPSSGSPEQVAAYEATLVTHLRAATFNLTAPEDTQRHFDRVLRYSHLSPAHVRALDEMARKKAQAALEELDTMARAFQDEDDGTGATGRFGFGAYVLPVPSETGDRET